jgi:hypothetical protein
MRMTEEQAAAHQRRVAGMNRQKHRPTPNTALIAHAAAKKAKRSKFKNIRCQAHDGTNFGSKLEREYYEQLLLRWRAGELRFFTRQVPFFLEGGVKILLDFMEVDDSGVKFVDTKGYLTPEWKNKLKQLKARYGIEVELVRELPKIGMGTRIMAGEKVELLP